jgi:hypothetical protein
MNFKNILNEIEKADPAVYEQQSDRREVLKSFGSKVAVAALPFAVGSLFNKATAGTTADAVLDALNLILEQEYLEYAFVRHGTNTGGLIPAADLPGFQAVEGQKKNLIDFLITTISTTLGGVAFVPNHYTDPTTNAPYVPAAYDFTAAGIYSTVFSSYGTFLMMGQVFADTGIHLLNGQIAAFFGNKAVLTEVFQALATKARHAAFYRTVRRLIPSVSPEYPAPWITNNIPPTAALQPYYVSEDNVTHRGIIVTSLTDGYSTTGTVPQISATAAFDEPYDATTVKNLMSPFKKL